MGSQKRLPFLFGTRATTRFRACILTAAASMARGLGAICGGAGAEPVTSDNHTHHYEIRQIGMRMRRMSFERFMIRGVEA